MARTQRKRRRITELYGAKLIKSEIVFPVARLLVERRLAADRVGVS